MYKCMNMFRIVHAAARENDAPLLNLKDTSPMM
jgi:hypothetical protein